MKSNRREFLQRVGLATGLAGFTEELGAVSGSARQTGYQIGCYTRPWDESPLEAALDGIADAGYRYAGIMTAKGKSWVVIHPKTTIDEALAVGALVKERGLKTLSVYGDFKPSTNVAENLRGLRALVDNANACDSPSLLLGGVGEASLYEAYYKTIAEGCDYAAEKKVQLTIKPHGGLNATGKQCREAIERVGHPNFRLWYDPGNIFYYSDGALDPVVDSDTVDGLVAGMSVKDFRPPKDVMLTPGAGKVDFPRVMRHLREGGFTRGPLVVECLARGPGIDITSEARKTRAFLEELIAGI